MSSHISTGIKYKFQAIHNGNTVTPNDANVFVSSDTGPITVTLNPPTDPDGEPNFCFFKNLDPSRAALTIAVSPELIDGGSTYVAPWATGVLVIYDGTNWFVFSGSGL